jgi:hypothetical protein
LVTVTYRKSKSMGYYSDYGRPRTRPRANTRLNDKYKRASEAAITLLGLPHEMGPWRKVGEAAINNFDHRPPAVWQNIQEVRLLGLRNDHSKNGSGLAHDETLGISQRKTRIALPFKSDPRSPSTTVFTKPRPFRSRAQRGRGSRASALNKIWPALHIRSISLRI